MSNYLMLNGKQINLTEEQVLEIKQGLGIGDIRLLEIGEGETFKIGKYEFILLEMLGDTAKVILKEPLYEEKEFGKNNNYDGSDVDKLCIEFGQEIETLIGKENLIEHEVDLTADDGLKCYGSVKRKMSLITAQMYRKYVYTLDKYPVKLWWWLATAYSTKKHDDTSWIKCVSPRGYLDYDNDNYYGAVRPFCILKSNIFVSK